MALRGLGIYTVYIAGRIGPTMEGAMTVEQLAERLGKVESGYRRLKVACVAALVVGGAIAALGFASPDGPSGAEVRATLERMERAKGLQRARAGQALTYSPALTVDSSFLSDYYGLGGDRGGFGWISDSSGGFAFLLLSDPESDASIFLDVSGAGHDAAILMRDYRGRVKLFKHTKYSPDF
jgi:hypothetical protein